jgi:hypothetical protein
MPSTHRAHELVLGQPVVQRQAQVRAQLLGAVQRGQGRDRHQAAVPPGQDGIGPHLAEEHLVGQPHHLGRGIPEQLLGAGLP